MESNALVECVPNFSEGRDRAVIDAISEAIRSIEGVKLLDADPGADTNRTVYTFAGSPSAVVEAALAAARKARTLIDMSRHRGAHPRMGALDVCPFIPISGISMAECVELSRDFGRRLAEELDVPVYFYEKSATKPERESLASIRSGEYEGLPGKLADPAWKPDFGPAALVPAWGATVTGARQFLVAFNVNLNTRDAKLAEAIAGAMREAGCLARNPDGSKVLDEQGNPVRLPGRLKAVRAIGWYIPEYRCAQVSVNLLDYETTPLYAVFEAVKEEAEKRGLIVTGSELVGLLPRKAILDCGRHFRVKAGASPAAPEAELVEAAVRSMGLEENGSFDPDLKIVERACTEKGRLAGMTLSAFVTSVSADSPAPGGGSVSALAGALGASLAAMVGGLTWGRKGYEDVFTELAAMGEEAHDTALKLLRLVDEDSDAYDRVLASFRLPRGTEAQKAARSEAIQDATKAAALTPLETARSCLAAMKQCGLAIRKGNRNSITDGATGAFMARAGLEGALLNVRINLGSLKDEEFRRTIEAETAALLAEADADMAVIRQLIEEGMPQ
jgi:glutamate formiminotransferase/formiminotetrahydrofolate cyclodeaminase